MSEQSTPEQAAPTASNPEPTDGQHPTYPAPGATPGDQVESAQPPPADPPVGGEVPRTPEETVDGQPAVQQGTETGPAPGPSPDAGGSTQQ